MGKLIVIDGLDGSGKATQSEILYNELKLAGRNVYKVSFPDYDSKSSEAVKMYLHGEIGKDASKLNPYMCGLFYTIDRAIQFNNKIFDIYSQEDSIIICDRYISANIIHQGGKLKSKNEQLKYFDWIYDTEVNKVGLPKEDLTIILSVPVQTSQKLINQRYNSNNSLKDIHESNINYLEMCYNTVENAINHLNSKGYNWVKIDCSDGDGGILSIDTISTLIKNEVYKII